MKAPGKMTDTQCRIARAVARLEQQGEPGFVADLVGALGLAGESSLTPTLAIMARNGIIRVSGGGSRGRSRVVQLTPRGRYVLALGGLPLLGSIPAGQLSEALADPELVLDDRDLLPHREGDFLLRVRGDSMIGDGILDGDKVLLRPNVEPRSGEIAAVLVGDTHEATLKHFIFQPGGIEIILRASNPFYVDVRVPAADVKVAGVFRGLIREASQR